MARHFLLAAITGAILLSMATLGEAAGRRFGHKSGPPPASFGPYGTPHNLPANYRSNPYYAFKAMNPQYNASIHARTQQNIGIPNGDIGLRGNGVNYNPW